MKRFRWIVTVAVIGVFLFSGIVFGAEKVLRIALIGDDGAFTPFASGTSTFEGMEWNVNERLVRFDGTGAPEGQLAESWEIVGADRWRIHLREGVFFTNGEPFNADAVKFSIMWLKETEGSVYDSWLSQILDVEVVDEYTADIITDGPNPELIPQLAWASPMYPPIYSTESEDYTTAPVGTGPYIVTEYQRDVQIVFEKNESYWGSTPEWDRIICRPIPDAATRTAALISGEVDFVEGLAPQDIDLVNATAGVRAVVIPSQRVIRLVLDGYRETGGAAPEGSPGIPVGAVNPFTDYRIRQALWHAIDTEALVEFALEGQGASADQLMLMSSEGYAPGVKRLSFDPARARELLADAGYDGTLIRFDFPNDRYANDGDVGLAITQMLENVGFNIEANSQSKTVLFPQYSSDSTTLGLIGWGALTMPIMSSDGMLYGDATEGVFGRQTYDTVDLPILAAILNALKTEMDPTVRAVYYRQLAELNRFFVASVPLYYTAIARGISDNIVWDGEAAMEHIFFDMIHPAE